MTLFDRGDVRQLLPYDGEVWYHTDVFTVTEAREQLAALVNETPWESRNIVLFGREMPQPRLACWYGDRAATARVGRSRCRVRRLHVQHGVGQPLSRWP
jgi:alkylated DNA repair dioxygenase AlkB